MTRETRPAPPPGAPTTEEEPRARAASRGAGEGERARAPEPLGGTDESALGTAAWFLLIVLLAAALRAVHLDATSLWWDEIVQIQTSSLRRYIDVLWRVRRGDPPGAGNAGAVPLDYLLLHAWIANVPRPRPEWLEVYYRLPSCFFSTAAVAALFLYARRFFGRPAAVAASLLLALSVPHALYAAEARFYSLFTFFTVLCLWAFSRVVATPRRPLGWLVHAVVAALTFLTGLLGLLLLAGQYVVLAAVLVRDARRGAVERARRHIGRVAAVVAASFAVFGVLLWRFYRGTWLFLRLRHSDEGRGPWQATVEILSFFGLDSPVTLLLFVLALAWVPALVRRDRVRFPIAVHVVTSFVWVPALALLATWKGYYVRPRHALFLLPYFTLVVGIVVDDLVRRGLARVGTRTARRGEARTVLAAAAAVALVAAPVIGFLRDPVARFSLVKPTHDIRGLVQHLAARTQELPRGDFYLLASERRAGAYLHNPTLAWYLRQYEQGGRRVFLRTAASSEDVLARLEKSCLAQPRGCPNRSARALAMELGLGSSIDVRSSLRYLLGIRQPEVLPPWPVGRVGVLRYRRDPRAPPSRLRREVRARKGWTLFEVVVPAGPDGGTPDTPSPASPVVRPPA